MLSNGTWHHVIVAFENDRFSQPFLQMLVYSDLLNDTLAISFQKKYMYICRAFNVVLRGQTVSSNFQIGHLCISKFLLFQMDVPLMPQLPDNKYITHSDWFYV